MIIASTPRLSFVNFNEGSPPPDSPLAICEPGDYMFQIILTADDAAEADTVTESTVVLSIFNPATNTILHTFFDDGYYFRLNRINETQWAAHWEHGIPGIIFFVTPDDCFSILLQIGGASYYSRLIKYFYPVSKYLSFLEYWGEENSYGFNYCGGGYLHNRVRLPMYLYRPQFQDEESIYVKHDGSFKITKSVTKKEYLGITDYFNESDHEKLKVALSHDFVVFETEGVYSGEVRKNGAYEIDWQELPGYSSEAPAKFKVFASPYLVRNDNCVVCEPYIPPPPEECIPITFDGGAVSFPDAVVGVPYLYTVPVFGGEPFWKTDFSKPSWMNIDIIGSPGSRQVQFSGTPDATGASLDVYTQVFNCEGGSSIAINDTIDVAEPGACVAGHVDYFGPPDGFVGVPYFYSVPLLGTAPFTIQAIEWKPSWMSINIVGTSVEFTGTPDAVATLLDLVLIVANCTEDSFYLSDTLNVSAGGCVPVAPDGTPGPMPDAVISTSYLYSFPIMGTPPLTLAVTSKPSWMVISIVGGTSVQCTGTVTAPAAASFPIQFTLTNCSEASTYSFTDIIQIA